MKSKVIAAMILIVLSSCGSVRKASSKTSQEVAKKETAKKDSSSLSFVDSVNVVDVKDKTQTKIDSTYETTTVTEEDILIVKDTTRIKRTTTKKENGRKSWEQLNDIAFNDSTAMIRADLLQVEGVHSIDSVGTTKTSVIQRKKIKSVWPFLLFVLVIGGGWLLSVYFIHRKKKQSND